MDMKLLSLLSLLVAYQSGIIEAGQNDVSLQNFPMGNFIFVPNFNVQITNETIKYQKITNSVNKCRNMCLVNPECELVSIKNDKTNGQVNCTIFTNGIFSNKIYAETDSYLFQRLKTVHTMIGTAPNQVRKEFHMVDEAVYDPERGKFLILQLDQDKVHDSADEGCSDLSKIVAIRLAKIYTQYQLEMFQHLISEASLQKGSIYQFWTLVSEDKFYQRHDDSMFFKPQWTFLNDSLPPNGYAFGLNVNNDVVMLSKKIPLWMICQSKPFDN